VLGGGQLYSCLGAQPFDWEYCCYFTFFILGSYHSYFHLFVNFAISLQRHHRNCLQIFPAALERSNVLLKSRLFFYSICTLYSVLMVYKYFKQCRIYCILFQIIHKFIVYVVYTIYALYEKLYTISRYSRALLANLFFLK
jgi:hypothetical protein